MTEEDGANEQRAYIKYLISNLRCPICHHRYTADDILVVDHKDGVWCMAIACPECETRGLVFAIVRNQQVEEADLPAELASQELVSIADRGPITVDDVLDLHEFLRDYHGDMVELLGFES